MISSRETWQRSGTKISEVWGVTPYNLLDRFNVSYKFAASLLRRGAGSYSSSETSVLIYQTTLLPSIWSREITTVYSNSNTKRVSGL
jgi:hypothetical protein